MGGYTFQRRRRMNTQNFFGKISPKWPGKNLADNYFDIDIYKTNGINLQTRGGL